MNDDERRLAEAVRAACLKVAQEAYENAVMSGLCGEGAMEAAIGAITMIDLDAVAAVLPPATASSHSPAHRETGPE